MSAARLARLGVAIGKLRDPKNRASWGGNPGELPYWLGMMERERNTLLNDRWKNQEEGRR